jgi:hypothetical protein
LIVARWRSAGTQRKFGPIGLAKANHEHAIDVPGLPDCAWFTVDANGWLRQRGSGAPDASWAKILRCSLTLTDHLHSH